MWRYTYGTFIVEYLQNGTVKMLDIACGCSPTCVEGKYITHGHSLGDIPILPCALKISICQTGVPVWWLWPVSLARICENVISNHRTRRDGKTMTRTMRQTEACSSFVRIQHGCSRSEALFRCSCGSPVSSQLVIYRRFVTPLDV